MKPLHLLFFVVGFQLAYARLIDFTTRDIEAGTCNTSTAQICLSCDTIGKCFNGTPIPLPKCKSDKPYCVATATTASCQKTTTEADCKASAPGYICGSIGYHPNPKNCKEYLYCSAEGSPPLEDVGKCWNDLVFDQKSEKGACRLKSVATEVCATFECKTTGYTVYNKLPSLYYAYCDISSNKTYLFNCPEKTTFNEELQMCIPDCKNIGDRFAHPENNIQYFECLKESVNAEVKAIILECIKGTFYNPLLKMCK